MPAARPSLRIGCLGWGSLLWDPRGLPLAKPFCAEGPRLPIEFSRVARDGRVTLVVDPVVARVPTAWALLDARDPDAAITALGARERIAPERRAGWVGLAFRDDPEAGGGEVDSACREWIAAWLSDQPLDAVVWTALPPRRPDGALEPPRTEELIRHLHDLEGEARARAEEYVRRAPGFVRTARRARFETAFGWTVVDDPPNPSIPGFEEPLS